jgi:phosphoenolpyruvate synthase/pyruvate phosphate dikinase
MTPDELNYLIRMRENCSLSWKQIALVLDKTDTNCRKAYSNFKATEGLPPKEKLPKVGVITASIGVKLKKQLQENPKLSYRKLARWLRETEGVEVGFSTIRRYLIKSTYLI